MSITSKVRHVLDELDRHRPFIEAALEYASGTHTFDDIARMVLTERVRFWSYEKSFFLTEVLDYPRERHYHMFLGGGDLAEIVSKHPEIEQAARDANCCKLTVAGRAGWAKALKPYGWKQYYTVCAKRVS